MGLNAELELFIAQRSLLEYYRTLSAMRAFSKKEILENCHYFANNSSIILLFDSLESHTLTFDLAKKLNATRGEIFDLNILALATVHQIDILFTKNIKDYPQSSFAKIQIIDPTVELYI